MRRAIIISSIMFVAWGCNTFDEPSNGSGSRLIIPMDTRPVEQALSAPVPISGGTLAVDRTGAVAVAADPDRDRISIVTLATGAVLHVGLERGDEPGRVVIDAHGRAYVALRGAGDVVRVDLGKAKIEGRTRVCAAPRGLAFDAQRELLHVACADGKLVSVTPEGTRVRSRDLHTDLRDVAVRGNAVLVSTYKSAELLVLGADGDVQSRAAPPKAQQFLPPRSGGDSFRTRTLQPRLAWRTMQSDDGSVSMLHQTAAEDVIDIQQKPTPESQSSYGGGGGFGPSGCEGIVQSNITVVDPRGGARQLSIPGSVLAVDMARSSLDGSLAVAIPGSADPDAPRPIVEFAEDRAFGTAPSAGFAGPSGSAGSSGHIAYFEPGRLVELDASFVGPGQSVGCVLPDHLAIHGQPTAVAFMPNGDLLVQSREPARIIRVARPPWGQHVDYALGGDSVRDTGHDIFHRDAGAGIACASCHGEGGDDGHTWLFSTLGPRRTQAVNVGLEGTAPFHWDGDMNDLGTLMKEVFVGRMGGVHQSPERLSALADWLFALRPPAPVVAPDDPAAERGRELFHSGEVGCAGCHAGEALTDNRNYDVGTGERGERLQVPSLRGVAYRAPFIHNGCAETLRDRFDPSCGGGDKHGRTSHLGDTQIDDLIAYLRTL
jgi:mono/diheme cytochrome c family protein